MDVSHLLQDLNPAQSDAVTCEATRSCLILAGAGSGKTRVLVHRIAWLIEVEKFSPYAVLSVTFTNKAAAEMRERVQGLLDIPASAIWLGTFHSIAHRLLRLHHKEANLSNKFQIIDSADQLRFVKRATQNCQLEEKTWPSKKSMHYINQQKEKGSRPAHIDALGDFEAQTLLRVYTEYEVLCQQADVIDFAEMLLRGLELLRDNSHLLSHYHKKFRAILVDEFQDTNTLQYAWIRLLAGDNIPVFAVGDDDQSIYGWRGAKIENIHQFSQDFNADTIKLEQNYRSTATILNAANAVIANNQNRLGKELWAQDKQGEKIDLYAAYNDLDEAEFVINQISKLPGALNEIAVIYRNNAIARVFETALLNAGIAYRVYGGMRFYERAEIKDAIAYCRIVNNPHDDAAFDRIINVPTRGVGQASLNKIHDYARGLGIPLWQAAEEMVSQGMLGGRAGNAIGVFVQMIESLSQDTQNMGLVEYVTHVVEHSELVEHYKKKDAKDIAETRREMLEELINAAGSFNHRPDQDHEGMSEMDAFLAESSLDAQQNTQQTNNDAVQLMTMHAAKGLEFDHVFMVALEEEIFPSLQSTESEERLEEERRLCYVGMTRAKNKLSLSFAETRRVYGKYQHSFASRFINEVPLEYVDDINSAHHLYNNLQQPALASQTEVSAGFVMGDAVNHAKFGPGVITQFEGSGENMRVHVHFDYEGDKILVLAYANLSRL